MWRKEDAKPAASSDVPSGSVNSPAAKAGAVAPALSAKASACVSQGIKIKGELIGSEDLFVDGVIDGKINLANSVLTVGPNASVKAEITSRDLVVRGRTEGKLTASERIQIWHTARVQGDLKAERISIEEGAELHGKVEVGRTPPSPSMTASSGKKFEASKPKEAPAADQKTASGAASASAD